MHDSKVIEQIIRQVEKQSRGPIERVELQVGELSEFDAEHLAEHLKEIVSWHVRAVQTPGKIKCKNCGFQGRPLILERDSDTVVYTCPECSKKPEIIFGTEIKITKITEKK